MSPVTCYARADAEAPDDGWGAEILARELECGPATVYETLRALRSANLLERMKPRRYGLAAGADLGDALRASIAELKVEAPSVLRPPRSRR
jgi:DNA-binding IclR family transcriptional regulator